ncbi:hypothetical protein P171DRAFT_189390 [Karstenula rhodostoma CBS 690.94]|uniref:Uncharacterized protein n=1 Tax=Karstenula rhodostoma CBS 690.94 TaxID=1392251 RepID=A0A9P4UEU1_9PLEO|nr:hypothetical protein P171DRAFT_189390 [Karstenula rhodostoma CBS 690.94]
MGLLCTEDDCMTTNHHVSTCMLIPDHHLPPYTLKRTHPCCKYPPNIPVHYAPHPHSLVRVHTCQAHSTCTCGTRLPRKALPWAIKAPNPTRECLNPHHKPRPRCWLASPMLAPHTRATRKIAQCCRPHFPTKAPSCLFPPRHSLCFSRP